MTFSSEPPLTRRAARDFARATGEQPSVPVLDPTPSTQLALNDELGQPLTRRRLRELRAAGVMVDTAAVTIEETSETPQAFASPETVEFDALAEAAAFAPAAPAPAEAPVAVPASEPAAATPAAPAPVLETPVVEAPVGIAEPELTVAAAAASAFAPPTEPKPEWTAPEGHWTRQLEVEDDDEDALETTYSREVGSANPTTSALIIPDIPAQMDLGGPLDSTGEILLTGSIPLSPSLSTTGSVERLSDGVADRDDRFDDRRLHESAQDGQPVRASAVASQHALGTPIVSDGKGRGHRGLTVLLIAASALAVIVTGLVIAAISLRLI